MGRTTCGSASRCSKLRQSVLTARRTHTGSISQAMGIAIMEECKKTPIDGCPTDVDPNNPDGFAYANTLEGVGGGDEHIWAR